MIQYAFQPTLLHCYFVGSTGHVLTLYVSSVSPNIEIPDSANVLLSYRGKKKYKTSPIHKEMRNCTKNQYPFKDLEHHYCFLRQN